MSTTLNGVEIPGVSDWKSTAYERVVAEVETLATKAVTTLYGSQAITGDGAISIKEGYVVLSKGSAGAITIADPIATTDDGKIIRVIAISAQAHVITAATSGFNAKGSSGTATFGAALGNTVVLLAYQGDWYVIGNINITVA